MFYERLEDKFLIRLEIGEEIHESLLKFASHNQITGGFYHGLGGIENVELGYFSKDTKDYIKKLFTEEVELVSMDGNISLYEGKLISHCHVCFGDSHFHAHAGHLLKANVSFTVEIIFYPFSKTIEKKEDPKFGLKLFHLSQSLKSR